MISSLNFGYRNVAFNFTTHPKPLSVRESLQYNLLIYIAIQTDNNEKKSHHISCDIMELFFHPTQQYKIADHIRGEQHRLRY